MKPIKALTKFQLGWQLVVSTISTGAIKKKSLPRPAEIFPPRGDSKNPVHRPPNSTNRVLAQGRKA